MPKTSKPTHLFSQMLIAGVNPVLAYERSGFHELLLLQVEQRGSSNLGERVLEVGDYAVLRLRTKKDKNPDSPDNPVVTRWLGVSLDEPHDGMRMVSEVMSVLDNRVIARGLQPSVPAQNRIVSAHFNGVSSPLLVKLEAEMYRTRQAAINAFHAS